MDVPLMKRMKELEDKNRRLKKMYAEERLKAEMARDIIAKKWWSQFGVEKCEKPLPVTSSTAVILPSVTEKMTPP